MGKHHAFVISDLHLGGSAPEGTSPGFQMCPPESRRRLARFIAQIEKRAVLDIAAKDSVELIINGDFLDFLAEEPFASFTGLSKVAVKKFWQIVESCDRDSPPGERVFEQLSKFVTAGHRLTILLGNHDIELALPAVRSELLKLLTGGQPALVEFLFDGEACCRGRALIEHGNRYDGWNSVAHGGLRAYRARASRGEPEYPFAPPAGSTLVTEVMNPLKRIYRFIDLLKPENEALIPILAVLHPEALRKIREIWSAVRARTDAKPGVVPDEETYVADTGDNGVVPDELTQVSNAEHPSVSPSFHRRALAGHEMDDETVRRTEGALAVSEEIVGNLVTGDQHPEDQEVVPDNLTQVGDGFFAWIRSGWNLLRATLSNGDDGLVCLRSALVAHRNTIGTTFDLDSDDGPYVAAARRLIGDDIQFVVFGHTHLPKTIPIDAGGRYINTGTWCPTIQLDERIYQPGPNDDATIGLLRRFVQDMGENRLSEWTTLRTHFAHVVVQTDGGTNVNLYEYHEDDSVSPTVVDRHDP